MHSLSSSPSSCVPPPSIYLSHSAVSSRTHATVYFIRLLVISPICLGSFISLLPFHHPTAASSIHLFANPFTHLSSHLSISTQPPVSHTYSHNHCLSCQGNHLNHFHPSLESAGSWYLQKFRDSSTLTRVDQVLRFLRKVCPICLTSPHLWIVQFLCSPPHPQIPFPLL